VGVQDAPPGFQGYSTINPSPPMRPASPGREFYGVWGQLAAGPACALHGDAVLMAAVSMVTMLMMVLGVAVVLVRRPTTRL
jgi:hypothetical protein